MAIMGCYSLLCGGLVGLERTYRTGIKVVFFGKQIFVHNNARIRKPCILCRAGGMLISLLCNYICEIMKKLILLFASASIIIGLSACGDKKKEAVAVPEAVITAFNAKYPNVPDVKWEKESKDGKDIYEGDFKRDGKKVEAEFDDAGNFIKEE
jgi:hypothetical protein